MNKRCHIGVRIQLESLKENASAGINNSDRALVAVKGYTSLFSAPIVGERLPRYIHWGVWLKLSCTIMERW